MNRTTTIHGLSGRVSRARAGLLAGTAAALALTAAPAAASCTNPPDNLNGIWGIDCAGPDQPKAPLGSTEQTGLPWEATHSNDGPAGQNAAPGDDITASQSSLTLPGRAGFPTILIQSHGGKGGDGGDSGATVGDWASGYSDGGAGGTGGNGGAVSIGLNASTVSDASGTTPVSITSTGGDGGGGGLGFTFGQGGAGSAAGNGGAISFSQTGATTVTSGTALLPAIAIVSAGGNGGNAASARDDLTHAYGLNGGSGGNGNALTVALAGTIKSAGHGVQAWSVGGNGGDGGNASSDLGEATGGNGGAGGSAGSVHVTLTGEIQATGVDKPGTGQTLGNLTFSDITAGIWAAALNGIGGDGGTGEGGFGKGSGGNGGSANTEDVTNVTVNGGSIDTSGYAAVGILAQSVGGHGGNGAFGGGVFVATGGDASPGGDGGQVLVVTLGSGSIMTSGKHSTAIIAQSIGGGGGFGGDAIANGVVTGVSLGGSGAQGGDGQLAQIFNGNPTYGPGEVITAMPDGQLIVTSGNKSSGIVAQSIGGGGGTAGDANTLDAGGVLAVGIGGNAGTGGDGGSVFIANGGTVQTRGSHAYGLDAQSIGGGGGNGGAANAIDVGVQITTSAAVGGKAGQGGVGSDVSLSNFGQIITDGHDATGIFAQSIGGGGGHGGTSLASTYQLYTDPEFPSVNLDVSLGGSGGTGGAAGAVTVVNNGSVLTSGATANAVIAQSIGGGGGNGGDSDALNLAFKSSNVIVNTVIGGKGGSGGNGGTVTVSNSGLLGTMQHDAIGVFAQSIGGGGGNGGYGNANSGALRPNDISASVTVTIGGSGGAAGDGGAVVVNNLNGGIFTLGSNAFGVLAQSVGGGGGTGGGTLANGTGGNQFTADVGVGGNGGAGGEGGAVTITNVAAIVTSGGSASAVYAQSVGGGGGIGGEAATGTGISIIASMVDFLEQGFAGNADVTQEGPVYRLNDLVYDAWNDRNRLKTVVSAAQALFPQDGSPADPGSLKSLISVNVGGAGAGAGGAAGAGGTVSVNNSGNIATLGAFSEGVFAQSVGGGGGNGGAAAASNGYSTADGSVGVGGHAGAAGDGGIVDLTNSGSVTTAGDLSFGLYGQSIGGGGGKGGASVGDPAALSDFSVYIGGKGGAQGHGGAVTLTNSGAITTTGRDAIALVAQSIGGGGGLAGLMSVSSDNSGGSTGSQTGDWAPTTIIPVGIGGGGGASGDGGTATVTLSAGVVSTAGIDSYGILAQSIGAGGGLIAGAPGEASVTTADGAYGADSFFAGAGGAVNATLSGNSQIVTTGMGAAGIVAQSIGGGGALIGGLSQIDLTLAPERASEFFHAGSGGDILVDVQAGSAISTSGQRAHGIFAQSAGQGGGLYGHADGSGFVIAGSGSAACDPLCIGTVTVNVEGNVLVTGADSYAIYALSRGNSANVVSVNIATNATVRSDGQAAGALVVSGGYDITGSLPASQINVAGRLEGYSGPAMRLDSAASIRNSGFITGDILAASADLQNLSTGTIFTTDQLTVGTLENAGTLWIGPHDAVLQQTSITTQAFSSTGYIVAGVDFVNGTSDSLTINSSIVELGGKLFLQPLSLAGNSVTILTFQNAVPLSLSSDFSVEVYGGNPSPIYSFSYALEDNKTRLTVTAKADYTPANIALNANQQNTANHLQQIWDNGRVQAGGGVVQALADQIASADDYVSALDSLGADVLGSFAVTRPQAHRVFVGEMLNCPAADRADPPGEERNCLWVRAVGSDLDRESTAEAIGFRTKSGTLQIGGQREVGDGLFLGASLAYEHDSIDSIQSRAHVSGDTLHLGAFLKKRQGALLMSLAVSGGMGWYDSHRRISIGADQTIATASPRSRYVGSHFGIGYQQAFGDFYLLPQVEVDATYVHVDSIAERGSPYALLLKQTGNTTFAAAPTIEAGGRIPLGQETMLRPFIRAGGLFEARNDWRATARFADAPDLAPFVSTTSLPKQRLILGVGAELLRKRNMTFTAGYDADLAQNYTSQRISARFSLSF
ncbi:hypothetical protein FJQ54_02280 [Sandaracinobacter neustonicus]|uniref:Autotransporter domain-containing protein n=1 Tax=Sandaracinobacter neustonicus TaxID=1715348 RepID=A0A501XSH3_9SPHN|nr:autotransporter outer membrane beta-barrel domain-containing protein [Sandaracinobacter neustonicus]TPE63702.1 hypothetical protein FJQ54_02280 [Sandaracinobacter neustonicus]